ncbi:DNA polymerase IV [Actinoplanes sp. L3-i22]|uniref:DNA polymerase IV n=1 Tax=Actinoplanes sp. L3-i22 TaxID=2836373 RepID=UPI002106C185|nr:DNA polymerase IV [Actinoplanes sp. L3-i22]
MRGDPSILHVDLDAMFAAVEQRDKPSLRGKPVVVGGVAGRGVVSTASYEARVFGVRSAMPMAQARRLAPWSTAYLSPRFAAYKRTSQVVMALLATVSPLIEQVSIDEAYVDLAVTDHDRSVAGVTALALDLKTRIATATGGVTGSIGAASSKLLAKIGSDLNKPNGLTVVPPGDELAFLHPLPVSKLGGVGPATEQRLHRSGIRTVGHLAAVPLDDLVDWFGQSHGAGLFRLARAQDDRPVVSEREAKSVSAEETFDIDVTDPVRLRHELDLLSARVAGRLRAGGLAGRTVNIKVRHGDFTTITRAVTRDHPTDDGRLIAQLARRLLTEVNTSGGIRLLGVGVSTLTDFAQDDLFTDDPGADLFNTFPPATDVPDEPAMAAAHPATYFAAAHPAASQPVSAGLPVAAQPAASQPVSVGLPVAAGQPVAGQHAATGQPPAPGRPSAVAAARHTPSPTADLPPPSPASLAPPAASSPSAASVPPAASAAEAPPGPQLSEPPGLSSPSADQPPGPSSVADEPSSPVHQPPASPVDAAAVEGAEAEPVFWRPGQDVLHDELGAGWVQGSGLGRVTVRFEGPRTGRGPVRTYAVDDPQLHATDPPDWVEA